MLTPTVSAVIPNRDGAELLAQTLPPLLRELPVPPHEVLVVDDASADDSLALLERDFPQVRVVALAESTGFGAACNRGFQEAQHELVLLLNSDMEVTLGSVEVLGEHFADPDVFAAGPEYRSAEPAGETQPDAPREVHPLLGSPAGGGLFRRQAFLELGGFDPLYHPFYWEDLDLGWNAWRQGWRIVRDTRVHFVHRESATIRRLYSPRFVARIRARNRCLFGWKNFRSSRLLLRHAASLSRRILGDLFGRGSLAALGGLLCALPLLPRVLRARKAVRSGLPDLEIMQRAGDRAWRIFTL